MALLLLLLLLLLEVQLAPRGLDCNITLPSP
jgi:hypothetical protein